MSDPAGEYEREISLADYEEDEEHLLLFGDNVPVDAATEERILNENGNAETDQEEEEMEIDPYDEESGEENGARSGDETVMSESEGSGRGDEREEEENTLNQILPLPTISTEMTVTVHPANSEPKRTVIPVAQKEEYQQTATFRTAAAKAAAEAVEETNTQRRKTAKKAQGGKMKSRAEENTVPGEAADANTVTTRKSKKEHPKKVAPTAPSTSPKFLEEIIAAARGNQGGPQAAQLSHRQLLARISELEQEQFKLEAKLARTEDERVQACREAERNQKKLEEFMLKNRRKAEKRQTAGTNVHAGLSGQDVLAACRREAARRASENTR